MKKMLILAGLIILNFVIAGAVTEAPILEPDAGRGKIEATDFAETGTFVINIPAADMADEPLLIFEKPGQPALTKRLSFDELSICQGGNGALPCVAMSVTLDVPFGGKRVGIEGISQPDDSVLVRRLRRIEEGDRNIWPRTGIVYYSWQEAGRLIENCLVRSVMQTHSLDVRLELKDGGTIDTIEPVIDEVFSVTGRAEPVCGKIRSATE